MSITAPALPCPAEKKKELKKKEKLEKKGGKKAPAQQHATGFVVYTNLLQRKRPNLSRRINFLVFPIPGGTFRATRGPEENCKLRTLSKSHQVGNESP